MQKILIVVFVFLLSGCLKGGACSAEFRYGLDIELFDTLTGEPISSEDSNYLIHDGEYLEAGDCSDQGNCSGNHIYGAGERPGVYFIEINKPGYETWTSEDVIVNGGDCHVYSVSIDAFLTPSG